MGIQKAEKDLVVGNWTLIERASSRCWLAKCACGTIKSVYLSNIMYGKSKSCGCERTKELSKRSTSHGKSHQKIHNLWIRIHQRCNNENSDSYPYYGGRGITVCDRWESFDNFYSDMGDIPQGCSLDRIDPNGNYEPTNCRWATKTMQARNTRVNHLIEFNGDKKTVAEWSEIKKISSPTIIKRIKRGWSAASAINTPT